MDSTIHTGAADTVQRQQKLRVQRACILATGLGNDRFGHSTGEKVLRDFARIAKTVVRELDCAARFGGDEFLIAFGGVNESNALVAAERLSAQLQDLHISDSQPSYSFHGYCCIPAGRGSSSYAG